MSKPTTISNKNRHSGRLLDAPGHDKDGDDQNPDPNFDDEMATSEEARLRLTEFAEAAHDVAVAGKRWRPRKGGKGQLVTKITALRSIATNLQERPIALFADSDGEAFLSGLTTQLEREVTASSTRDLAKACEEIANFAANASRRIAKQMERKYGGTP